MPASWKEMPLRYISTEWCDGPFGSGLASEHYRDSGARVVRLQNIREAEFAGGDEAYVDEEYFTTSLARHSVQEDDVLVAGLGDDNNFVGRACVAPKGLGPALVKADCFRFRLDPEMAEPRFIAYALSATAPQAAGELSGGSTRQRINLGNMASRKLLVPPLPEQVRIANFLDEQTARIDALIAEKERLQATLDEWRAAELTRICFGDAAATEATGNPWIPKLPKGWRPARLKHVVTGIEQGWSPECEGRLAEEGEWGVLKAGASNGGVFRDTEHKALPAHLDPIPALEVRPGDVVVTRASGSADLVGSFAYVYCTRPQLMLSDKNFRLKFSAEPSLQPELLAWMCSTPALREQVRQYVSGAEGLAKNIGSGSLRELWLAVPPAATQAGMVEELHATAERLRSLQEHLVQHIERLREYRSSLISAAVTGQLQAQGTTRGA